VLNIDPNIGAYIHYGLNDLNTLSVDNDDSDYFNEFRENINPFS
jgi:hypothetical protein